MGEVKRQVHMLHLALALLAAVVLVLCTAPRAEAAETSGSCGNGVKWRVEQAVLTISGRGDMADYGEYAPAPWKGLDVTVIHVESGVKSVGDLAFFQMDKVTAVTVADSVEEIGTYAFFGCRSLQLLQLGSGLERIGASAFEHCSALMSLRLPDGVEALEQQAF
ncbi:MAG: hypothetical protein E7457_02855, partial [Ruminococcaceae bacterium]|nr:hypothetical protein [Oscillospiraceae bacterium]